MRMYRVRWNQPLLMVLTMTLCFINCGQRSIGQESSVVTEFSRLWQAAEDADRAANYSEAARFYNEAIELFPYEPMSRFRLASCLARLNKPDQALTALQSAIEYGWADVARLKQAEEWQAYQKDERFVNLLKAAERCRQEPMVLYAGGQVGRERPAPLLVVLHGLGGGPRMELPYWKPVADHLGMVLVAPKAGTRKGPMLLGWQRADAQDSTAGDYFDLEKAAKCVDEAIEAAAGQYKIDRDAIVLAGYSQGGGVALHLLARKPEGFRGAVLVCSLFQPLDEADWQQVAKQFPLRVQIIAGEFDKLLQRSRSAVEVLQAVGISTQFEIVPQSGHEYPADSTRRLVTGAKFVLSGNSANDN